jgi:hypothetical protein
MIHLKHLKSLYEFDSIEPNPKKHQKNSKIRVRYGRTFSTKVRCGMVHKKVTFEANKQ